MKAIEKMNRLLSGQDNTFESNGVTYAFWFTPGGYCVEEGSVTVRVPSQTFTMTDLHGVAAMIARERSKKTVIHLDMHGDVVSTITVIKGNEPRSIVDSHTNSGSPQDEH